MTKYNRLMAALICFALAALILLYLLDALVLAQEDPDAIGLTPLIWLENKYMVWKGAEWSYYVRGWWFEDGDYYHVGDERVFAVTREVYWEQVLIRDSEGRMTKRLCKLGIIDYDNF